MSPPLRAAVFVDRDGTLISERDYLSDPEGVALIPGAVEALRSLRAAGYALVVVTNQSGIARGWYTEADYRAVTARVHEELEAAGASVDATYHCPHHPDVTGPCACRKPAPGLYLQAAGELGLDLEASWFVGDKVTDVLPALELGGRGVLVRTGYGRELAGAAPDGIVVVDDLAAAAALVLAALPPGRGVGAPGSGVDPSGGPG